MIGIPSFINFVHTTYSFMYVGRLVEIFYAPQRVGLEVQLTLRGEKELSLEPFRNRIPCIMVQMEYWGIW
jgi:hypothetical protein